MTFRLPKYRLIHPRSISGTVRIDDPLVSTLTGLLEQKAVVAPPVNTTTRSRVSLGDGGGTIGIGKTVRARPSFGFGLVADRIINMGELSTENLDNEGGREVEDEDSKILFMEGHIQETSKQLVSPLPSPKLPC